MNLNLSKLKVLLVEDLEPMRDIMSYLLSQLGFGEVISAVDGEHALKIFRDMPDFDLIVTDWQMPKIDGLALAKNIRQSPYLRNKEVPIILVTGFSSLDRIAQARDSGVNEYMVKPFTAKDIAKRVEYIIRAPRPFIRDEAYVGPDRRRKAQEFGGEDQRKCAPKEKTEVGRELQVKAGVGTISDLAVRRSQGALDNNKVDFAPIASGFLDQYEKALGKIKNESNPTRRSIEDLIDPIMQIKANSLIFKYKELGETATIGLSFLDNIYEVDQNAIILAEGFYKPMRHMVLHHQDSEEIKLYAHTIKAELEGACKRYQKARIALRQKALKESEKHK